jgi:hypothetical protein
MTSTPAAAPPSSAASRSRHAARKTTCLGSRSCNATPAGCGGAVFALRGGAVPGQRQPGAARPDRCAICCA